MNNWPSKSKKYFWTIKMSTPLCALMAKHTPAFAYRTGTVCWSPFVSCISSLLTTVMHSLPSEWCFLYSLACCCKHACIRVPFFSFVSHLCRPLSLTRPFCLPSLLVSRTQLLQLASSGHCFPRSCFPSTPYNLQHCAGSCALLLLFLPHSWWNCS